MNGVVRPYTSNELMQSVSYVNYNPNTTINFTFTFHNPQNFHQILQCHVTTKFINWQMSTRDDKRLAHRTYYTENYFHMDGKFEFFLFTYKNLCSIINWLVPTENIQVDRYTKHTRHRFWHKEMIDENVFLAKYIMLSRIGLAHIIIRHRCSEKENIVNLWN